MSILFREHPLSHAVTGELHSLNFEPLRAPERVSYLAVVCGDQGIELNVTHFKRLLEHHGQSVPEAVKQQYPVDLGPMRVGWERHNEFVTYTFSKQGAFAHPFAEPVLHGLPAQWLCELPGEVIAAVSLAIDSCETPERDNDALSALFDGNPVIGSRVVAGLAGAWSDFKIQPDGCVRILVHDCSLSEHQAGRLVKPILDINCYRALALIGFPLAWKVPPGSAMPIGDWRCWHRACPARVLRLAPALKATCWPS